MAEREMVVRMEMPLANIRMTSEVERNLYNNLQYLGNRDQVKFVICNRADYDWSVELLKTHDMLTHCEVLFSPSQGEQDATELADSLGWDADEVRQVIRGFVMAELVEQRTQAVAGQFLVFEPNSGDAQRLRASLEDSDHRYRACN